MYVASKTWFFRGSFLFRITRRIVHYTAAALNDLAIAIRVFCEHRAMGAARLADRLEIGIVTILHELTNIAPV
jgi:hypothetical protein